MAKSTAKPARRSRTRLAAVDQTVPAESRHALITRLWRAAERQVSDIERRHGGSRITDLHVLSVLVRTLRELNALDQATGRSCDDLDAGPKDIDEFRNELARCVERMIAERAEG